MTKNITIWILSVLVFLITCMGIRDFYQTMTFNEVYIGSHFGVEGLIYFKEYPLLLAILFGITVFLPPISIIITLLFRKKVATSVMLCSYSNSVFRCLYLLFSWSLASIRRTNLPVWYPDLRDISLILFVPFVAKEEAYHCIA